LKSGLPYNDKQLIIKLKRGDRKAFETIFYQYKARLYYFTLGYLHSKDDAEEIVQTTFVSLWEHRHLIIEKSPIKNYIFRIAVNSIYNYLKHQAVRRKYEERTLKTATITENYAEDYLREEELSKTLGEIIEQLPEKQREVFNLSRRDGMSHGEIAKRLGLSIRSVENQVYRALKFIREKLIHEYSI